jgi:hypothetical protein
MLATQNAGVQEDKEIFNLFKNKICINSKVKNN